jgi:hypothetical protein
MDTSNGLPPLPMKRMKELAKGDWPVGGKFTEGFLLADWTQHNGPNNWGPHSYPYPRMAADIRLTGSTKSSSLDLRRAVATVFGDAPATVRVLACRNVFLIQSEASAHPIPAPRSYDILDDETGARGIMQYLSQSFRADSGWPGMTGVVTLSARGGRRAAAIVTSVDTNDPLESTVQLAASMFREPAPCLIAEHEVEPDRVWPASGIDIEDETLRLPTASKPGASCVGLYAGQATDKPAWHSGHTTNYNSERTFWPTLNTNHPEMQEHYERMISEYLLRARWLSQNFEIDGADFPHNIGIQAGVVQPGRFVSTVSGPLRVLNPWPGSEVRTVRNGRTIPVTDGERDVIIVATVRGDSIVLSRWP